MVHFVIAGAVFYGAYKLYKFGEEEEARKYREDKQLWNDGKCPKCGRNWHVRYFFPQGSRGEYQDAAISCRHCKTRAELHWFIPPRYYDWEDLTVQ